MSSSSSSVATISVTVTSAAVYTQNEKEMYHTYHEMTDDKHNTSFVFIKGIADNPIRDHSLNGPTYQHALYLEAEKLQFRIKQLELQIARNNSKVRYLRKSFSKWTGMSHFWKKVYNGSLTNSVTNIDILRSSRKISAKVTGYHHFWANLNNTIQWYSPLKFPLLTSSNRSSENASSITQVLLIENPVKTANSAAATGSVKGMRNVIHSTPTAVKSNKRSGNKQLDTRNSTALVIYNATYAQGNNQANISISNGQSAVKAVEKSRKSFFVWW